MCYLLIDIIFQSSSFSGQKSNERICILCIIANNFQQRDRKRVLDFTIHHSHTSVKYNSGLKLQSSTSPPYDKILNFSSGSAVRRYTCIICLACSLDLRSAHCSEWKTFVIRIVFPKTAFSGRLLVL